MKNFIKNLILPIAILTMLGGFAPSAFAVTNPMTAVFDNSPLPLFGEVNFLPGDSKDGDVTVTNNTGTSQSVYAESINGFDPDGLGTQLRLKVFENANPVPIYNSVFSNFLSAGPVPLSSLGASATTVYKFEVSFIDSEDNDYQGKSLGFDLCIGFSGGALQCGTTVVGGEDDTSGGGGGETGNPPPGGPPGGTISGSGGGGGGVSLAIFNERVTSIVTNGEPGSGTATIEWDTNLLATSQVIYGLASGGLYTLDVVEPIIPSGSFYGYPLGTVEDPTKVIHHTMLLTGLSSGQTYVYRVVSRASPPTVSVEHQFTLALAFTGGVGGDGTTLDNVGAGGDGISGGNTLTTGGSGQAGSTGSPQAGTSSEETATATPTLQLASALFGLPAGFFEFFQSYKCWLTLLLMLLGIIVGWIFVSRWFGYEEMMSPYELRRKRIAFFIGGILLMLAYALIFWKECIIIPLLVILVALVAWLAWHHHSSQQAL